MTYSNNIIISSITSFCIGIGISIGLGYLIYKNQIEYNNKNNNINNNINKNNIEYKKMYKIIELASGIDKDPYNRKISPKVVLKFCQIAKSKSINLDTMTDEEFDLIYEIYTNYLIHKYENK